MESELKTRAQILELLTHNLLDAQERNKSQYDKYHTIRSFVEGGLGIPKAATLSSEVTCISEKSQLSPHYFGPF